MAHFLRLIVALLSLALVHGNVAAVACTQWMVGGVSGTNPEVGIYGQAWASTLPAATNAYTVARGSGTGFTWQNPADCGARNQDNPGQDAVLRKCGVTSLGAVGYQSRAGNCGCVAPLVEVNGQCVDKCAGNKGKLFFGLGMESPGATRVKYTNYPADPGQTCDQTSGTDGCTVSQGEIIMKSLDGTTGYAWVKNEQYTGTSCSLSPTPTAPDSTSTVSVPTTAPGKCTGTFNGKSVSYDCGTKQAADPSKTGTVTTSNPDGSTTTVTTTAAGTTSCTNGVCTTSTTTTTATTTAPAGGGSATTATTSTSASGTSTLGQLCAKDPKAAVCGDVAGAGGSGEGSGFGGACKAFTCSGDAVMCAIAKAASDTKCQLDASAATQEAGAYDSSKANGTATGVTTANVAISQSSFDTSNALGQGASCIADLQVTVSHQQVTLPLSSVCPHLGLLGQLLLACSFLAAIAIVGKPT